MRREMRTAACRKMLSYHNTVKDMLYKANLLKGAIVI